MDSIAMLTAPAAKMQERADEQAALRSADPVPTVQHGRTDPRATAHPQHTRTGQSWVVCGSIYCIQFGFKKLTTDE